MGAEREGERPTRAGLEVAEVKRKGSLGTVSLPPSEIQAVNGLEGVMAPVCHCLWGHFHFIDGCCLHSSIAINMQSPSCCQRPEPAVLVGQLRVAPSPCVCTGPLLMKGGESLRQ